MGKGKVFEVRDRCTFIPIIAIELDSKHPQENKLLRRGGCCIGGYYKYYLVVHLTNGISQSNKFAWTSGRTMQVAHEYIENHWDELLGGEVIDIEYIMGEIDRPKESECI